MHHSIVRSLLLAVILMGLGSLTARAWESSPDEVERYSTLSTKFVTPHTPWARPYAQGTLRGYYFVRSRAEGMQTHAREAAELMQRLDLTLDVSLFYSYYGEQWFCGDIGPRRIGVLLRKPHDVFIFQDVAAASLPDQPLDAKVNFLAQVQAGAGVVLIGTDDGKLFADATVLTDLPPFLVGTGALKVLTAGKGRIVQMPARPRIPYRVGWEVEYDYWQEQLTRAVLWAAQREPKVQLQVTCEAGLDRRKLPAKAATVSWKGATPGQTAVSLRLRRWDGQVIALGQVKCDQPNGQAVFTVPVARGGAYHLDAFARTTSASAGWATLPVDITAPAKIATLELVSRQPLPARPEATKKLSDNETEAERRGIYTPYVESGEEIKGKVVASGDVAGLQLRVSLMDRRGRELLRKVLPAAGEQAFAFKSEPWLPSLLRVEAKLVKGDEEIASDYRYLRITNRRQGLFNFVIWDGPGDETLGPYAMEKLADLGVTAILHHTPAPLVASAFEMSYVPWTGGNVHGRDAEEWPDPEYGKGFAQHMLNSRGSGVLSYSLGDEGATSGAGGGPKTEGAFRTYLKQTYGDIAALNKAWEGAFKSFDEITRKSAEEAPAAAPTGPVNLARLYDSNYFPGWNFVENKAKKDREWVRKLCDDPKAGIGFEGSGGIGRWGCDPELICRELDMWVPYSGISEQFIRSVAPRDFVRSSWMGYDQDAAGLSGNFWRHVINDDNSVWYWMWSTIGAFMGFQSPNLDPPPPVQAMLDDTRVIREGLGDLLRQYEPQQDGIALLYSHASIFVNGDFSPAKGSQSTPRNSSYLSQWGAWGTWNCVFQDLNMQYNFVTDKILTSDEFAAGKYKVLVLPNALCLSPKAVAAVRKFVEDGGTVIADTRPAFYDDHCHPYPKAALDDLFGIRGGFEPGVSESVVIDGKLGIEDLKWSPAGTANDRKAIVDPSVVLTTGQALGKAGDKSVCIVNTVGKGRAILLNLAVRTTFTPRDDTGGLASKPDRSLMPDDAARFFLGLLHASGVERAFNFVPYRNEKMPFLQNVRVQRWRNGEYEIAGFLRQVGNDLVYGAVIPDGPKWPVSPERKENGQPYTPWPWVYDLKNSLTVGPANWYIVPIEPGRAMLYAHLPGPLPPMKVELPQQAKRGTPVVLKLSVPEARGLHGIKLRATLPDGQPAKFWDQTVQVAKEPVVVTLPLAWNDPVGTWTITCTDLFGPDTERTWTMSVE